MYAVVTDLTLHDALLSLAVIGATSVSLRADPVRARAARDLIAKSGSAVPGNLRPFVVEPKALTPPAWRNTSDRIDMVALRDAIRASRKVTIGYENEQGRISERTIWPIAVG